MNPVVGKPEIKISYRFQSFLKHQTPKIKNPKIIIVGVETETIELENKAILECIVGQNELQTVDEEIMNKIEVLGKFVKKNKNNYGNIILEVQSDVYGKIIKLITETSYWKSNQMFMGK
ncbi:hypothetical protein QE152_g27186 [Popillia japonica]|uniref:Uncharacterized protein n=1 Tax=Popillia japonica TaxID=7064 RepID=A0AAW1JWD6_POPJA